MKVWNPWHGCHKYSEGCLNCYVYRRDGSIGKDASIITRTKMFNLPLQKKRDGRYKLTDPEVYTCMTSDFFIAEADGWRDEIWQIIKERTDLHFIIITKRIVRYSKCLPADWHLGYSNVTLGCTVENQKQADLRLPIFQSLPCQEKFIICEPLLEKISLHNYLNSSIKYIICGGESGSTARICDYDWIINLREQCQEKNVGFRFKQTGTHFKKGAKLYTIPRHLQQAQGRKANIDI